MGAGWETKYFDGSDCELLAQYTDGGLCPVLLDDTLGGENLLSRGQHCSFKVVGKLGRGSYATVWLVKDKKSARFLALKVLTRNVSNLDNEEMRVLNKLGRLLVAFFYSYKPTGDRFLCLGMQPLGCTIYQRGDADIQPPANADSIRIFISTLVKKVLSYHAQGIRHGDLSPSNITFGLHRDALLPSSLRASFEGDRKNIVILRGAPESEIPPERPAHLPEYIVTHEGNLLTDGNDMSLVEVIDFGKAFDVPSKKGAFGTNLYQAYQVAQDPEGVANEKTDLWALGCVIAYGLTDRHLFRFSSIQKRYASMIGSDQLLLIDKFLRNNRFLKGHEGLRMAVAELIHSLVQADPEMRDAKKTRQLLARLDSCDSE
ncbi:hypothetical protein LOZ12_005376 [Ophidiomyces ophidiicola]|uniref:Uncharacterized protein n=1 Tax=Ophidiomyces ophidiicola TaxID=1387563 RepID=A0ACB8UUL4_9EURO|nr:hypothetical protein LOZ62_005755 [Ophidiomyces ophidiicola]KAI1972210.1 hypothetical protein LOZ56_002600 [Ophidiomyces ophidiicola]KAI2046772.1 hypothetical protein LOZ38_005196 [Ophidiomyces ophidiicola]KAI2084281.1 hypothetical protein LOZ36_004957 [Ophidiomyces ophidiicola]KAI2092872.1 hypothetical protein LOZ35_004454 [Ophidiomyces ophidiicola]